VVAVDAPALPAQTHPDILNPDVSTKLDKNKDLIRSWIEFSNTGFAGSLDDVISPD
jgi:hypothetical protein